MQTILNLLMMRQIVARCKLSQRKVNKYNKQFGWNYAVLMYRGGYGDCLVAFNHATPDSEKQMFNGKLTRRVKCDFVNRKTGEIIESYGNGMLSACECGCVNG